jgi:hypothetical protein
MNGTTAQYIWLFVAAEVMEFGPANAIDLDMARYSLGGDLPADLDEQLSQYFCSNDKQRAVEAALVIARRFYLASFKPDEHLMLVAHLLGKGAIDLNEACVLAQVDRSNFSLMSNDAKNVVMLAESMAEEQRLGLLAVDADDLLARELNRYLSSSGSRLTS